MVESCWGQAAHLSGKMDLRARNEPVRRRPEMANEFRGLRCDWEEGRAALGRLRLRQSLHHGAAQRVSAEEHAAAAAAAVHRLQQRLLSLCHGELYARRHWHSAQALRQRDPQLHRRGWEEEGGGEGGDVNNPTPSNG